MQTSHVSRTRRVTISAGLKNIHIGNYVTPSIWTAAESSITVVSACLPSLRPLFARVLWEGFSRPEVKPQPSQRSLAASWRSATLKDSYDGSFNRLPDWSNNVAVQGGTGTGSEEYEIGSMYHLLRSCQNWRACLVLAHGFDTMLSSLR